MAAIHGKSIVRAALSASRNSLTRSICTSRVSHENQVSGSMELLLLEQIEIKD